MSESVVDLLEAQAATSREQVSIFQNFFFFYRSLLVESASLSFIYFFTQGELELAVESLESAVKLLCHDAVQAHESQAGHALTRLTAQLILDYNALSMNKLGQGVCGLSLLFIRTAADVSINA
jgi:hypothetical protein